LKAVLLNGRTAFFDHNDIKVEFDIIKYCMAEIYIDSEKIIRYFKGEYSEDDASYVEEIFQDNNRVKELKTLLSDQFDKLLSENGTSRKNLDHTLYKIHYDINTRLSKRKSWSFENTIKWTFRIAAAVMLPIVILIGLQMFREARLKKEAWVEIKTPFWTRAQFSLPDGTTGWLNSNSSIRYDMNFNVDRQVTITGEAFFDVFKDKRRPFIVNTNDVSLKVLGTRFNITSYEDDKNVEVVLEEGELVFNGKEKQKSFTMKPNDLLIYNKTLMNFSTEVVQPQKYLSWTAGKLVFRNDPLDVIASRLSRWYNIDVEIKGSVTEDLRLRATFVDEDVEEVLDLLKRSLPVDYKIVNGFLTADGLYTKKKVIITLRVR
jgi:ferric-dicitrate binding protein FerR (iron transport regulator)